MSTNPNDRIRLIERSEQVRVTAGEHTVANTRAAIELQERGYPPRLYIPHGDVASDALTPSAKRTHCPHKGDATYFSVQHNGETLADAAWSYETPIDVMAAIAGHVAFDHPGLTLQIDDN